MSTDDVVFTTGAGHALDLLLGAWSDERRVIACVPGEFGPNLAVMTANGFEVSWLPVDSLGCVVVDDLTLESLSLVHLTVVPSHRGIVQPLHQIATVCRSQGVPLVVDAAQGLGHVDCTAPAAAVYGTSRKWLAGPRGIGVLAIHPDTAARLRPRLPLGVGEANIAARVGFSVAVCEHIEHGVDNTRAYLAGAGRLTRTVLAELPGWRIVEPLDSPTAITTLVPTGGVDVESVRAELIARHSIVTTVAGPPRAPFELDAPVLRLSPHVDVTEEDLTAFARALSSVGAK
jgi:pyridoxal 5-phosphate dependent beta-lyase